MDIAQFKKDIQNYNSDEIVQACIFTGATHVLGNMEYTKLRRIVAEKFSISHLHIHMVGSGKLGFSIKPNRRYGLFNDESDIDLAIISPNLFESVWRTAFLYSKTGAYWPKRDEFFSYLSEGWIRPDKFPKTNFDPFFQEWWDFFMGLTRSRQFGDFPVRAGIYQSEFFLEQYQKICVEQCKRELEK